MTRIVLALAAIFVLFAASAASACDEDTRAQHVKWLALEANASCEEVTAHYVNVHQRAWAAENDLPTDATFAESNWAAANAERRRVAKLAGLPPDATWTEIHEVRRQLYGLSN